MRWTNLPWILLLLACSRTPGLPLAHEVDQGLTGPAWSLDPANQAGARFGAAASWVGDVNGDGFGDVVAGAPGWDGDEEDEGRAFLFLGGAAGLGASPAWMVSPAKQAGAQLGAAVAGIGDVNGDGFADVVVGAPHADGSTPDEGVVYLFLGSADALAATPAVMVEPADQAGAEVGATLGGAGDVNGDGLADLIVGAPGWDGGQIDEGCVYLLLGTKEGFADAIRIVAPTAETGAHFGAAVAGAGDVDGDGLADVIVGTPSWQDATSPPGAAFVFLGTATGIALPPVWKSISSWTGGALGSAVAGAGDVNGDGFADVLVGEPRRDSEHGAAHLFLGSPDGPSATEVALPIEPTTGMHLGQQVAGVGDVNGDGYADVAVAAMGVVRLLFGSKGGPAGTPWLHEGEVEGEVPFVAGAGDVDGDGFADLLVGEPGATTPVWGDEGKVTVFRGGASGVAPIPGWWTIVTGYLEKGRALCMGDVTGDALADLAMGEPYGLGDATHGEEGRVWLLRGSEGDLDAEWVTDPADQATSHYGFALACGGDTNDDGYGDLLVGASDWDGPGGDNEGRAFLHRGGAGSPAMDAMWTADPAGMPNAQAGQTVALGDVNGDGIADVVVGAPEANGDKPKEGRVYVYLGGDDELVTMPWTADPTDQRLAEFGRAVATADVNGDGYDDLAVGAPAFNDAAENRGIVYLYLGSASGLASLPDWTYEPDETKPAYLGSAVGAAGDVNGDGYADLAVGASIWQGAGKPSEGRAYLFLGGAEGLSADPVWILNPTAQQEAFFGSAVAGGDVNGDGYSDVAVGARGFSTGDKWHAGAAYLYLGGEETTPPAPALLTPATVSNAGAGLAVAMGDANGDGFADLAVGAPASYGNHGGAAYLYFGGSEARGLARGLGQFRSDGSVPIAVGGNARAAALFVTGRATQEGPLGGLLALEVEVKRVGKPFDGRGTTPSASSKAGDPLRVLVAGLSPGAYRWRARVVYPVASGHGRWVSFGGNPEGEADFRVREGANGAPCTTPDQCSSGQCAGGLCCAAACGLCTACDPTGESCVDAEDDVRCEIDCDSFGYECHEVTAAKSCAGPGVCKSPEAACTNVRDTCGADGGAGPGGDAGPGPHADDVGRAASFYDCRIAPNASNRDAAGWLVAALAFGLGLCTRKRRV